MKVKLEDVCERGSSSIKQSDIIESTGDYPIFGAAGYIGNVDFYQQEKPYVAVVKDGAGIGRTTLHPAKSSVIGTMQYLLPKENVLPEYLYYVVRYMHLEKYFTGATIPHIYFKDYKNEQFNLDSLDVQKKIVNILGKCEKIISDRQSELAKLDDLIKARFIELFGDPVNNPKAWNVKPLLEMGYCKNGMNFRTGDSGIEMHCLGVGDFKDYSIIDGTDHLPMISLNEEPSEECMLQNGDIVFVRSNGNKNLVGRCVMVYPYDTPTTYSGFCIRYRLTGDEVIGPYLLHMLKMDSMRKKMAGRGANIQNLNQQILASLDIPLPPIVLQKQFADFITRTDKSKAVVQKSLDETQMLFDSLMQKYFG